MNTPVEWFGSHKWSNADQIKNTPLHVDMEQLKKLTTESSNGPNEAWNILHLQQTRKPAGWEGISNIQEIADYYLQTLPPYADRKNEEIWVDEILNL